MHAPVWEGPGVEQRLVLAVRDPAPDLTGPAVRDLLATAGARWVQLNLPAAEFASALRLSFGDHPVDAFVALDSDADPEAVVAALSTHARSLVGWRVETTEPLPPRPTTDGEPLEALANIAVLRVPASMPYAEWRRIWQEEHTTVAIETQGTFGYVQHRVLAPIVGGDDPWADRVGAVVEEHFPPAAATDPHAFYGSGGDPAELERRMTRMFASIQRFGADRDLDLVPTRRLTWSLAAT